MRLAEQTCKNTGCGRTFRPPDRRRRTRCPRCAGAYWGHHRGGVDYVPTAAQLDVDRRCNRAAVDLALKLARKAARAEQRGLDAYVDALIRYAEDTAAGHTPPADWQHHHLGHLIAA